MTRIVPDTWPPPGLVVSFALLIRKSLTGGTPLVTILPETGHLLSHGIPRFAGRVLSCVLAAMVIFVFPVFAAAPQITEISFQTRELLQIRHTIEPGSYYILYRGSNPSAINTPVDLWGIGENRGFLRDVVAPSRQAFYRVRQVSLASPLDSDGDGTSDVAEVQAGTDPFHTGGSFTTFSLSPQNGEAGVAVTRETIIRFSSALSTNAVLSTTNFSTGYSGRKLLSRVELASDRKSATLFYLEPLPGSTRIYGLFDTTGLTDTNGRPLDGDQDGQPGGVALFSFETLSTDPIQGTAVIGRVFASERLGSGTNAVNVPLQNVTITVDGAEETIRTTTDAQGRFVLANAPAGRFFVHVDGRTVTNGIANGHLSWDARDYYPVVGKAWEAQPGVTNNLAGGNGEIYLPLIRNGTLQPVSPTQTTVITFPASVLAQQPSLRGVEIMVPPNGLLSENGVRGGMVGIAPVPPDRLPEPLPSGLKFPLVITIQTDGPQNFDQPVPVRFPNLPDPNTGIKLAAGEKSALWSFNHDKGSWEIAGPMTVTADGTFVETDPGVGVRQPGWHGTQPGTGAGGGPLSGPPCKGSGGPGKNCHQNPDFRPDDPANYNGCGPDGWDYVVPDNPNLDQPCASFFNACKAHDIGYNTCGRPQSQTDSQFLQGMLAACDCIFDLIDKAQCIVLAHAYFEAVTSGGEDAWNAAQEKACICDDPPPGCGSPNGGPDGPPPPLSAQSLRKASGTGSYVPQTGPHHFAVIDVETRQVVQRGRAGTLGIAFTQLILQPNRTYDIGILQDATLWEGHIRIRTGAAGSQLEIPTILVKPPVSWDFDNDGLHDIGELIMGTNRELADTDDDGIADGSEIPLGLNPLGESPLSTGVIASADTPGIAVDVAGLNNLVAVADSAAGVSIFDVRGLNPILQARIDTPGNAQRVSWDGIYLAVADGTSGLAIIDVTAFSSARIIHQLPLGNVTSVRTVANLVYAGLESGQIVLVEMSRGTILRTVNLGEPLRDLALGDGYLYALTTTKLYTLEVDGGDLSVIGSLPSPTVSTPNTRLSLGDGLAYAVHGRGYNTFDLSDPEAPRLLAAGNNPQFGWEHIVPTGSGIGVAAVGTAFAFDQQRVFSLYDLTNPQTAARFITAYQHPGHARAVSVINGLAYGAAHDAGLLVINFLAFDTARQPPTISLSADFPLNPPQAEENKIVRVTANVTDDVQVRNVEFYVNDILVANDGSFPFEHRFVTPPLAAGPSFMLRAVAFDTGGNRTETTNIVVQLVLDATSPRVIGRSPDRNQFVGATETVVAFFNEPINPVTIAPASFTLSFAGPDNVFGTPDDAPVPGGILEYRNSANAAFLNFTSPLGPGRYRAAVNQSVRDLAGNPLSDIAQWEFLVLGFTDDDLDGVPDNVEADLGLDSSKRDSDGDGIVDGDEDIDGDGLRTSWELAYLFNPRVRDSNGDGIEDQNEDPDKDTLSNMAEQTAGTNPMLMDSDGDGWPDEAEVTAASDPLFAGSRPGLTVNAVPVVEVILPRNVSQGLRFGVTVAAPPVEVLAPRTQLAGLRFGVTVATPPVEVLAPRIVLGTAAFGVTRANPVVEVLAPRAIFQGPLRSGVTVGQPTVEVKFGP